MRFVPQFSVKFGIMKCSSCSPGNLKLADRIPVQEKEDPTHTKRYRPVSALPTVSKMKKIFKVK